MATELVTFKLDDKFLSEVDATAKKSGFGSRTEFIRNALREKVDEIKLKQALIATAHLKGALKKKITDEDIHRVREEVFKRIEKTLD